MEPLGDWAQAAPWKSRQVLLIAVTGPGHRAESSNGVVDKRRIIEDAAETTLLLAVWAGAWSTTVREIAGRVERETVLGALA